MGIIQQVFKANFVGHRQKLEVTILQHDPRSFFGRGTWSACERDRNGIMAEEIKFYEENCKF
jgi:hypothetical protein